MRSGQPMPERIANAPELRIGLQLYLQAFFDLDSERSHDFAPKAIPRSKVAEYAKELELDEEQAEDLFFFVKKMDGAHLKRLEAKTRK